MFRGCTRNKLSKHGDVSMSKLNGVFVIDDSPKKTATLCRHRRVRKSYVDDIYGTRESEYCADCGEFMQSCYYERRTGVELGGEREVWKTAP